MTKWSRDDFLFPVNGHKNLCIKELTSKESLAMLVVRVKQGGAGKLPGSKSAPVEETLGEQLGANKSKIPEPVKPKTEINPKKTGHIFRNDEGHVQDSPANRVMLEDVANNEGNKLGTDKFGNEWHAETQADGTQVWTQSRNGQIFNGGVNKSPKTYDPNTGLSSPTKP